jgi:hypothetical protein
MLALYPPFNCLFLKQTEMYCFSPVHQDSIADLLEFVKAGLDLSEDVYWLLEIYRGTSRNEVEAIGYVDFIRYISWWIFHQETEGSRGNADRSLILRLNCQIGRKCHNRLT